MRHGEVLCPELVDGLRVAEEAGPLVRGGDLRQLLPAEVALDAPLAERPGALVADQQLAALSSMK